MSHLDVLREIEARGLALSVSGADLRLQGPSDRIDADLVGRVRAVKADLLAHLAGLPPAAAEGVAADRTGPARMPLTPLQGSYLVGRGDAIEMGHVASHVYHEIEGAWDVARLESALRAVVARHDALRTHFTADGRQVVSTRVDVHIPVRDLRPLPASAQADVRHALRRERSHLVLPADRAPLLAADVTILADDRMVLHVSHDGLVVDGISMFLLFREWWLRYTGADGRASGPTASFAGYVEALELARTRAPHQRSRERWLARLDDLPSPPDLPLRTSPSAIARPVFRQRVVRADPDRWARMKSTASELGVTPSGLLLAAYAEVLATWGSRRRFLVNITVAHRPPIDPAIADTIGPFSDTALIDIEVDRRVPFVDRARAVQAGLRHALDHRHFSGIEVLRELRRRGAADVRAPITFNSAIGYVRPGVDGGALELFGREVFSVSQTPQVWLNAFAMEQHGGATVQLDGVDELFPDGLLDALAEGYQTMLDRVADGSAWSAASIDLLPEAQRRRRRAANDTAAPTPAVLLHEPILVAAERRPDAPAVITSRGAMSYGELVRRASHVAAWLRDRGVRRDELVGLVMTRGPEQLAAILGTVMAGGAYLPIDAGLPVERQRYLIGDGRVRCVVTNTRIAGSLAAGLEVLTIDAAAPAPDRIAPVPTLDGAGPDDLAYVLYTSGTTGQPKGVMVSHRAVANVVADCNARFGVGARDRFFGISAFHFDLSVYDVFGALSSGAALVLPDHERAADPRHWLELCASARVTVWNSVPAIVSLLRDQAVADGVADGAADGVGPLAALRLVMMSGDRIPPGLPADLSRLKPDLSVISLGGPTETTIWNILHPIGPADDGSRSIPYGRPNANNRCHILDADGDDAPDWVTGEICAAGTGLARGYWGDPERTAERFFDDARRGERLYRTGDLGRYLPDGEIDILGRADFQIKVNGYRIEAGEVETRLVALDTVRQAAVVKQTGAHGDRLIAHLAPSGADRPEAGAIRELLRAHLPDYMLPSAVVWHDSLPLTRNGKVDRGALVAASAAEVTSRAPTAGPAPTAGAAPTAGPAPAAGAGSNAEMERSLAALWASILRRGDISPEARFYDLGGDSLAAARVLTSVRKQFGISIPLDRFHEVETVRAMATHVAAAAAARPGDVGAA